MVRTARSVVPPVLSCIVISTVAVAGRGAKDSRVIVEGRVTVVPFTVVVYGNVAVIVA